MIADVDFERIIATWLADGAERAPRDRVADALAQVGSTRQRRRWLRPVIGNVHQRGSLRTPLGVVIVLALLVATGLAVGIGSAMLRAPDSPPPTPPAESDIELRPIPISDWSARVSVPTTWDLVGDPSAFSEFRRFRGEDPEGDLSVSHESPFHVTICDPGCSDVDLPITIPYSAEAILDGLRQGVSSIAGSDAWADLPADMLPELEGGAWLETTEADPTGRPWRHVYIVGLRERNAAAIVWRQPADVFDPTVLDAVLANLELPPAPVYTDGDLVQTTDASAGFTMPTPGFWSTGEQPALDGLPLDGVVQFGPDRLMVSIGRDDGTFGWCHPACRKVAGITSLDDLEREIRGAQSLGPAVAATLGGESARAFGTETPVVRRFVVAIHESRPVAVMIDLGDWQVADGIVDEMIAGFSFIDPAPPLPPEKTFTTAGGRVTLGLSRGWHLVAGNPDQFLLDDGHQRLTVRIGTTEGWITPCARPAGPWERCLRTKVRTLDDLVSAVLPDAVLDHGVGPPTVRSEGGTLDGEPSVVIRVKAYEHPARGGQEVVYIAAIHDGRPYLVRVRSTREAVVDLDAIIAGFRFVD